MTERAYFTVSDESGFEAIGGLGVRDRQLKERSGDGKICLSDAV
jgi:hypothetical protein